jgi:adenosylcobyric acid synthase
MVARVVNAMPSRARSIMVLGTASHVGKSLLTAALCRIFARHGHRVAPFKSQNMSLNSAATPEGHEIGRAQALQAEAAGIPPSVHMNPVLIKPSGNATSQVIVQGRIWGQFSAADYHLRRVADILPRIRESFDYLASNYDLIVLEGAGSPAEINLKQHDIVNMRMAEIADAPCLLVGDIDRGGVFASLLGTIELLNPAERNRIAGFVINKFRGDRALLEPGITEIEQRLSKPCFGVVPHLPAIGLDEEDSLGLPAIFDGSWSNGASDGNTFQRRLRIAVVALPSLSNFTDIDALRSEASVDLRLCRTASSLEGADLILIPGSKQTVDDLTWLQTYGIDAAIRAHANSGLVVGICGGMQMLGMEIHDPHGVESVGTVKGLGLIPISTVMQPQKTTVLASGQILVDTIFGQSIPSTTIAGYEIHIGETIYAPRAHPFAKLVSEHASSQDKYDGCITADTRIFGTYLHGIFDDDAFRHIFITAAHSFYGLASPSSLTQWKTVRESSLNRLADHVEASLSMEEIFRLVGLEYRRPSTETMRTENQKLVNLV